MPEYIEREVLLKTLKHRVDGQKHHISDGVNMALSLIEDYVKAIPTADVVEVVRCKKCRHYNPGGCANGFGWCEFYNTGATDEHYCSHGERKEVVNNG